LDWVETAGLVLDGNPFSFQRHEYLKEPFLMKDFNVYRCVIDGMPEIDKARAFARKYLGSFPQFITRESDAALQED